MPAGKKLIQGLQEAKHSLTDPEAFPPEPTARNLAEGYRYRLAHLGRLIEMEMRLRSSLPGVLSINGYAAPVEYGAMRQHKILR